MAYQLSFWEVLKAFFVPVDPLFYILYLAVFGFPLLFMLWRVWKLRKKGISPNLRPVLMVEVFIVTSGLAVFLIMALLYTGSGWRLEDGKLQIKGNPGSPEIVELDKTRIALVESTGSWQATLRTGGIGLPGFSAGRFRFENGKKALYFRHLGSSHEVVLEFDGRYYVLLYPGVEDLYRELIARGAQPAKL
ncbi:hypothetical protein G7K71_17320 [Desulfofundulus sp. TPOSR]|uniref:Bacterial Pleckstrin homology domain-containing protein n=3 Tax=Desulfofundulus TaxID=2282741 RepID=A0AAU8PCL7_DESK7|nr:MULTISPECIES: hypothetical protein [Desulfofundulus]AEG16664.1 hypothetical protein Desku_3172 [Desulfofundulus kuznetsovii DSM 6115]MDQ0286236.1 hypothetical protein [Desulfofundulus luciae]NHM28692.1 hypothetical protein [Desulfofundulus sp. TPOSR]